MQVIAGSLSLIISCTSVSVLYFILVHVGGKRTNNLPLTHDISTVTRIMQAGPKCQLALTYCLARGSWPLLKPSFQPQWNGAP